MDRALPLGPWVEHVIAEQKGCDTYFTLQDLNDDGVPELIAAQFWGQSFSIVSTSNKRFDDSSKLTFTTIDATVEKAFGLEFVDVNGDGKKDFLLTNHQGPNDDPTGSLYAFTFDAANFNSAGSWKRHTLSTNIKPITGVFSIGAGAPGVPKSFYPKTSMTGKPAIALAGDDARKAFVVVPNSQDVNDWNYTTQILHDCSGTVGSIAVGDIDGDGYTEIFVPCYSSDVVHVYSFTP